MRYGKIVGYLLFAILCGCAAPRPPKPADESVAKESLVTALDAWKQGEKPESLLKKSPSINAIDDDWHSGKVLIDYKIHDETRIAGSNVRFTVTLTLQKPNGQQQEKKVVYGIGTDPGISIVREDF